MNAFMAKLSHSSAIVGGGVLALLALSMTLSILGGAVSKLGNADWLKVYLPAIAQLIEYSGIRTIKGIYEILMIGIAFVLFAFLPIAHFKRDHAVVDIFCNALPKRGQQWLIVFWEVLFFVVIAVITWRMYHGMVRIERSGTTTQDLAIPLWWGYLVALFQMGITTTVALYCMVNEVMIAMGRIPYQTSSTKVVPTKKNIKENLQ